MKIIVKRASIANDECPYESAVAEICDVIESVRLFGEKDKELWLETGKNHIITPDTRPYSKGFYFAHKQVEKLRWVIYLELEFLPLFMDNMKFKEREQWGESSIILNRDIYNTMYMTIYDDYVE